MRYNIGMEKHVKGLLSKEDIDWIKYYIDTYMLTAEMVVWDGLLPEPEIDFTIEHKIKQDKKLGKITFDIPMPDHIKDKLVKYARDNGFRATHLIRAGYVEYSNKWGKPILTRHKDKMDLFMIDYQLDANVTWPLGLGGKEDEERVYQLDNNDALVFFPNRTYHRRMPLEFADDQYVRMIFFDLNLDNDEYQDHTDNFIISNIFSDEDIETIYEHIEKTPVDKTFDQPDYGHTAYFSWLPENIVKKIEDMANNNYHKPLVLRELSFARYDTRNGRTPLLYPHFDNPFQERRITYDIQVRGTKPWPLVVEGKSFELKDNEALVFSGTHQIHWREHTIFNDDDYVDMIFCHFSEPIDIAEKVTDSHRERMQGREKIERDAWYQNKPEYGKIDTKENNE
jgi:hypothetical protein